MQRCFFANDEIFCATPKRPLSASQSLISATSSSVSVPETTWSFKVQFDWLQFCSNEFLAISGSCTSLGNWDVQASVPLMRDENPSFWTLTVVLPRNCDIRYRYFVCAVDIRGRKFVRFWETHFGGRLITQNQSQNINSMEYEIFGLVDNKTKVQRGWLTPSVTVILLKFYQAPFVINSCRKDILLQVKVTAIKLKTARKCGMPQDSLLKPEQSEEISAGTFAFCEVASLQGENGEFHKQEKYGTPCGPDNFLIFNITINAIEQCAFLIDLYDMPGISGQNGPLNHFGYQYVVPQDLKNSSGTLDLAIICGTRHRPIGSLKCDYLIVKAMETLFEFNLEKTFQSYWNAKNQGLYCGHRGCGHSFWWQNNILRENCPKSFDLAIQHGAKMIELDVQLTKDSIPIVFHDTQFCVSRNFDIDLRENDIIHLPLSQKEINMLKSSAIKIDKEFSKIPLGKFTLEQLTRVKIYEPPKEKSTKITTCSSDTKSNRPFITLQEVLREVNAKIGFVVDIKWPQITTNDNTQAPQATDFDKNQYIDSILSVVIKNAGSRRIIFASYDADICTMVRLKQNLYPVMFAAKTNTGMPYLDPQKTISIGVYFAHTMEFWGVSINSVNILHIPGKISDLNARGLRVFCWGLATRYEDTRKYLKKLGVDGIICDRLNHVLKPLDLKKKFVFFTPLENKN